MKKQKKDHEVTSDSKPLEFKNRKQLRKQKKEDKKKRIRQNFNNKNARLNHPTQRHSNLSKTNTRNVSTGQNKSTKQSKSTTAKTSIKKPSEIKPKTIAQQNQDDKIIELYQEKLGMKQGKDKYQKIAKNFGFDDDLFDFLNGISSKVKNGDQKYPSLTKKHESNNEQFDEMEQEINESISQDADEIEDAVDQIDEEQRDQMDEMFDNLDQIEEQDQQNQSDQDQDNDQPMDENDDGKQEVNQQVDKVDIQERPQRLRFNKQSKVQPTAEQVQIKKLMNSLFNKLSDGNVLLTFRQFMKILSSYPRSITIPIYSELFTRFNLMIEKPLFHILATNAALLSALHYAIGNRLLGPVLHSLTQKYLLLNSQKDNESQVMEIGYSKRYQRLKNFTMLISLLYNYGSVSGQFIESFVHFLTKSLNKYNIQLIYIIVQKCGIKVRQNDPSTLKSIISTIKESIQKYRAENLAKVQELQKINFIELQLTEIKFNKKSQSNPDQRMAFLQTFISKNVPKEIEGEKQVFPLNFQDLINIDTVRTNWWLEVKDSDLCINNKQQTQQMVGFGQVAQQKRKLLELAKSFHMVTEIKKNIFLSLMDSKDYLEATQKILELKIKNYQDVATVLVEVCTLQPNFNPYYPLVAAKMANVMPKFRLNLQYAIWDHLKLVQQYELRRTSNLAKFAAKLISDPLSNSSLSVLKFYPDLSNIRSIDTTFLNIFFGYFFKKVKKQYLSKLASKLREQNNRGVKQGIKQFLCEFQADESIKQKSKILRRLLEIELDQRKQYQGDQD